MDYLESRRLPFTCDEARRITAPPSGFGRRAESGRVAARRFSDGRLPQGGRVRPNAGGYTPGPARPAAEIQWGAAHLPRAAREVSSRIRGYNKTKSLTVFLLIPGL